VFLVCQHLSSGTNLRECADESWVKAQAVPDSRLTDGGEVVPPAHRLCSPPRNPRIFMVIGNRTLDLPTCRMASSGMLSRVVLVRNYGSEELSTSIIRVTRIGELGTTPAVTSNQVTGISSQRSSVASYS
jgi:hypothetical protein